MSARPKRILLLDLYKSSGRPYIQSYLYLAAFFDYLQIDYALYRWCEDEGALLEQVGNGIGYVFINLIMGPVLGLVEPVCRLLKEHDPRLQIWVGGTAVLHIRELLEQCPDIDRVSNAHPRRDPDGFAQELCDHGLLDELPVRKGHFPCLVTNRQMPAFIHQHLRGEERIQAINLSTSSGCHHRCAFCYLRRAQSWQQPLDALFADLALLQARYDIRYFEFADDNFTSNRRRLQAFCQRALQSGLDLSYFCLASVDTLSAGILDRMVASGLKRIYIGVDAIQDDRIEQIQKNYRAPAAFETIDLVRTYPVDLTLALVLGSLGETRAQIEALYHWAESVEPELCYVAFLTPYPGTPSYEQALALGFQPPDSLSGWAVAADFAEPKQFLNPGIDPDEYRDWKARLSALSTRRFRSDIGESVRQLA